MPTPASARARWRMPAMVPLQIGQGRPVLFVVHGVGGDIVHTTPLVQALGKRWTAYGFQRPDLYDAAAPAATTVPAMAERYLRELGTAADTGSAVVVGFSLGASIALEMGQQAARRGVPLLLLINLDGCLRPGPQGGDAPPSAQLFRRWTIMLLRDICTAANPPALAELMAMDRTTLVRVILDHWRRTGDASASTGPEYIERYMDTAYRNYAANHVYPARIYGHRSLLITSPNTHAGHRGCLPERVLTEAKRYELRGDHGNLFVPPTVHDIASIIRQEMMDAVADAGT